MLGKLINYDLTSISRTLIPLWILAPVISLLFSISIRGLVGTAEYAVQNTLENQALIQGSAIITGITTLVFFGVMIAILVMTVLFIIQRFWNGLLKEEGYLMFTLPVETWELVVSKGICATVVSCVSILVGVVSCVVMFMGAISGFDELWNGIGQLIGYAVKADGVMIWSCNVVLFVLLMIVGTAESVYRVYAAMALGQLFEGHRVVGACVSYIGIGIAWSLISGIFTIIVSLALPDTAYYLTEDFGVFGLLYMLVLLLITLFQIVIWHLMTVHILSRHLNLE